MQEVQLLPPPQQLLKQPIRNKVYHYPDILSGRDYLSICQAVLRQHGYKAVEIGTPHYVDARRLNLLQGFDMVNNESLSQPALDTLIALLGNSPLPTLSRPSQNEAASGFCTSSLSDKCGTRWQRSMILKLCIQQTARGSDH